MSRKLVLALLPVAACVGFTPAQAAPSVKTVAVAGTVGNWCSVTSPLNLSFSMKASSNGMILTMVAPTNLAYSISCNVKSSLAMQATALRTTATVTGQESAIANYTATLGPWGNGNVSATTTAAATDNGSTLFPANPTAVSSGSSVNTSGTVTIGTPATPVGRNKFGGNAVYNATIKLTLTPNN